jgi:hypothetical protein
VLNRIAPEYYMSAANWLGPFVVRKIALLVDKSIHCLIGLKNAMPLENSTAYVFPLNTVIEDDDAFSYFDCYLASLSNENARQVTDRINTNNLKALVDVDATLAERWYSLFINLDNHLVDAIYNVILSLADVLSEKEPDRTLQLLDRIQNNVPFRGDVSYKYPSVKMLALVTWAGEHCVGLDEKRFQRLDSAKTDVELSQEVNAALLKNRHELLSRYIEQKLSMVYPAAIARGLMVAGFSDQSDANDDTLQQYTNVGGFLGSVCEAAKYAYERNIWARHWFQLMNETTDPVDFWRYKVLFVKIADDRFYIWKDQYIPQGPCVKQFSHTYDS